MAMMIGVRWSPQDKIKASQPGHSVLVERRLQAIRGGQKYDDAVAEPHRFGDLIATLGLDTPGLGLRLFRIEPVVFECQKSSGNSQ